MTVGEYRPKKYIPDDEDMDVDASNDGDYIVCPKHQEQIIYVFGTGFWRKEGGKSSFGWVTLTVEGWCHLCQKHIPVVLGSYGG